MIKKISFVLFLLISASLLSQNLDKYKYVLVPSSFDFLKKPDQYQTSSLTKFLLKKKGFTVFLDNETYPEEVVNNRCLTLKAKVVDESSMFTTKSIIQFEDCYGKVVYKSEIGKSKIKEYKKAYHESIRNAYATIEDFVYNYNPSEEIVEKTGNNAVIVSPKSSIVKKEEVKETVKEVVETSEGVSDVLYAQPKGNGFQLINLKPEVVFVLLKTNTPDTYIIKGKNGTLTKNGKKWVAEYYENDKLVVKSYTVKF